MKTPNKRKEYIEQVRYINIKTYRIQKAVCVILSVCAACLLFYVLCDCEEVRAQRAIDKTQEKLAKEVLRFHVLANSDSGGDQKVKRQVRDAVLEIKIHLQMLTVWNRKYQEQRQSAL